MSQYMIRVEGLLSAGLVASFPQLQATQHAQTVLHGHLDRQSELADLLEHLRNLGINIVEVHRVPAPRDAVSE
jgi:hypothetical protein